MSCMPPSLLATTIGHEIKLSKNRPSDHYYQGRKRRVLSEMFTDVIQLDAWAWSVWSPAYVWPCIAEVGF